MVADSLDHGIQIMRAGGHRFRLVTLQGDVMHSGGSMTGGSAQSRMVNLFSREREVKELADRLREGKQRFDQMKQQLQEGQALCLRLRQATADAVEELHQQQIAVTREHEHVSQAETSLNEQRERLQATLDAIDQLKASIEQIDHDLSLVTEQNEGGETDQSAMEQRTEQLQDALYQAREEERTATELVTARSLQLNDLRHTLDVMRRDRSRNEEERVGLRQAIDLRKERLLTMAQADGEDETASAEAAARIALLQSDMQRQEQAAVSL